MVQFLLLIALNITVLVLICLYQVRSNRKHQRSLQRFREEPDFSRFEGNQENDDVVDLTEAHDDRNVPFAEEVREHRFADGNYDPLTEDDPHEFEITSIVEPSPIFGTRVTVRQSCMRAAQHMERCAQATYDRLDYAEAEAFARAALHEVNRNMKRDHWYAPFVLNWLAYLRYEQGFAVEAGELWEQAEQIAIEWYEQCQQLLPDIRQNLRMFRDNLYGG